MSGWKCLDLCKATSADVEHFLEQSSPVKLSMKDGVAWISVRLDSSDPGDDEDMEDDGFDMEAMMADFSKLTSSGNVTKEAVLELGVKHGVHYAKWLFFVTTSELDKDHVWDKLVRCMHQGKVSAVSAKISPRNPKESNHVICVHIKSYMDKEAVFRLHSDLRECGIRKPMYFKTDLYTYLGIYRNNPWGLNASIFKSRWNPVLGRADIKET